MLVVVGIVGGGAVVLLVLANGTAGGARASSSRAPSHGGVANPRHGVAVAPHSMNFGPNPAQPQLDEAIVAAREAALSTFDQSAVAEQSTNAQYQLGLNQDATAKAIAFNTNSTQLKQTGIETAAQQAIAQEEATAQEQAVQAETSAYQNVQSGAQSTSLWQSIIGGITSIFPFLGSSGLSMGSPIAYGTPAIPATQYAVPDLPPLPPSNLG
jgi:hypothetical protein